MKAITASFTAMEDEVEEEESDEDIEESEEEENLVIPELDDKEGEGEMFGGWVWDERSLREDWTRSEIYKLELIELSSFFSEHVSYEVV